MKWLARLGLLELAVTFMTFMFGIENYNSQYDKFTGEGPAVWNWAIFCIMHLVILTVFILLILVVGLAVFAFPEKPEPKQLGVTNVTKKS